MQKHLARTNRDNRAVQQIFFIASLEINGRYRGGEGFPLVRLLARNEKRVNE